MKPATYIFSRPHWLYGAFGGESVPEWSLIYPKKHVFGWNVLMKMAPYLYSGPNCLYGAFGGKTVPDENYAQFCLKSPLEFVFAKSTFSDWIFVLNRTSPIFIAKRARWRDFGAKVSRSEVSSILKNTFSFGIFWWNRPHTSFLGLIGYMVRSGAKLFRTKSLLNFASKALPNSIFQKTRFRFEFLW